MVYRYKPTRQVRHEDLPGIIWRWLEAPPKLAENMPGLPISKHEFGVIATNREIGHYERNLCKLEPLR